MKLFRTRFQFTDANPKTVGFFFAQYIDVMKYGKDSTDAKLKQYLFDIITELGVPEDEIEIEEPEEENVIELQEINAIGPIINRKTNEPRPDVSFKRELPIKKRHRDLPVRPRSNGDRETKKRISAQGFEEEVG